MSIDEVNPHTGFERRYVLKHRHEWEKVNGVIPDGMCLRFIDGNKQNVNVDNLELIKRLDNLTLNQLDYANRPEEIKPVVKTLAKLRSTIIEKNKLRV